MPSSMDNTITAADILAGCTCALSDMEYEVPNFESLFHRKPQPMRITNVMCPVHSDDPLAHDPPLGMTPEQERRAEAVADAFIQALRREHRK